VLAQNDSENRIAMVRSAADAWFERFPECALKENTLEALKIVRSGHLAAMK
jgi:hypothetical protein